MAYKVFTNGSVLQASEINDNLMRQSVMVFSNAAARTAAITSPVEGMVTYLEDTNQLFIYSGSSWIVFANSAVNAYSLVSTIYFTSSGTFTKETYPWLRAIKVKCQGAGAAGWGSTIATRQRPGGGGGGFAESLITDISGLASSVTVTIGAGGSGSTGGGTSGGTSSFGSLVSATGGGVDATAVLGTLGGVGTGQLSVPGSAGGAGSAVVGAPSGSGGDSVLGSGGRFLGLDSNGESGRLYGGGGAGCSANTTAPFNGGDGASGIVIVELYA